MRRQTWGFQCEGKFGCRRDRGTGDPQHATTSAIPGYVCHSNLSVHAMVICLKFVWDGNDPHRSKRDWYIPLWVRGGRNKVVVVRGKEQISMSLTVWFMIGLMGGHCMQQYWSLVGKGSLHARLGRCKETLSVRRTREQSKDEGKLMNLQFNLHPDPSDIERRERGELILRSPMPKPSTLPCRSPRHFLCYP